MRFIGSKYLLWLILALPGAYWLFTYVRETFFYGEFVHASGELGARLLILAMAATPLRLMFPQAGWTHWLIQRRRYLGVAAFIYAALHAAVYLERQESAERIVEDARYIGMWTGWIALFIMLALALTSNDASVKAMHRAWKTLHRLVYVVAFLTLLHWVLSAFDPVPAAIHFGLLALLEGYRVWKMYLAAEGRH